MGFQASPARSSWLLPLPIMPASSTCTGARGTFRKDYSNRGLMPGLNVVPSTPTELALPIAARSRKVEIVRLLASETVAR